MSAPTERRDRVTVTGPDTWTFLQSLLSQDVDGMAEGETRRTLLLTPQGKVDVLADVTRSGDDAVLTTDPGYGRHLADALIRFKIRTKVEIAVEDAAAADDDATMADEAARIAAGIPRLGADLDDSVIPQEAFLDEDAVSFTKGCFVGQELVCRIDARGHVNRFLRHLVPELDVRLPVGADVIVGGKTVGAVTSSAPGIALGYVRREVEPPAAASVGDVTVEVRRPAPLSPPGRRPGRRGVGSGQSDRVGAGDGAEPLGRRLDRPLLSGAVDADQTEAGHVAERPLEVVEQRPVEVAAHVEAVVETTAHPAERVGHVADPLRVVGRADAVLGHVHGRAGDLGRVPDADLQRLGPVLVAHVEHLDAGLGSVGQTLGRQPGA